MRVAVFLVLAPAILLSAGCGGFYAQAIRGHMDLMSGRQPIDQVLADPATDPELKGRLELVQGARRFASEALALPDNDSYTSYVSLDRDYVVWNVFAAPEFSVEPRQWCFPVAGCVVYRGYFQEARARRYADKLAADGWDVHIGGAAAYSTLGRFDDPVLSTMMGWDDAQLVAILFHELAHQRLYVKDDSAFNEGFATAVETLGMERWFEARGDPAGLAAYEAGRRRSGAFNLLLAETRDRLAAVYRQEEDPARMRQRKADEFRDLSERYQALRKSWGGFSGYDRWFETPWNNARLVPVSTYGRFVPAFRALFREQGGDFGAFFEACEALAAMPVDQRQAELEARLAISPEQPSPEELSPGGAQPGTDQAAARPPR